MGDKTLDAVFRRGLRKSKPEVLGVAVAYVSVSGCAYLESLCKKYEIQQLRLVTDIKDGVTHPVALAQALKHGWEVKVVDGLPGTFHPKLYVGGEAFDDESGIENITFVLIGSANLSSSALHRNGECSHLNIVTRSAGSAGRAWRECWSVGTTLTETKLADYAKYFSERNRKRSPADLVALGVADKEPPSKNGQVAQQTKPPPDAQKALPNTAASTAWAGLQSFTGDFNLQVEFPKDAGAVLARLLGMSGGTAQLLCDDGVIRSFIFRYYEKNGMFRLNVRNDTPGAAWARANRQGIAVVEDDGIAMKFHIIQPGQNMADVIDRSVALGTWGRTPTRLYGWY